MSIIKMRLSNRDVCKVTFTAPSHISETAKTVNLAGEFNNWELPGLLNEEKKRKVHNYT